MSSGLPPGRPLPPVPVDPDLDPLAQDNDESRFLRDLELAKKLSLETSQKEETERRRSLQQGQSMADFQI